MAEEIQADSRENEIDFKSITIASYNIHSCIDNDGNFLPEQTLVVLKNLDADIIGLQEVGTKLFPERKISYLQYFSDATGFSYIFGESVDHESHQYGNALLSRYPILRSANHTLYHPASLVSKFLPGIHRRTMLEADIKVGDRQLRVFVTHLGLLPWERKQEVKEIKRIIEQRKTKHMILMGDFNEWLPETNVTVALDSIFGEASAHPETIPVFYPFAALDRIYYSLPDKIKSRSTHESSVARKASDHFPVLAEIEF